MGVAQREHGWYSGRSTPRGAVPAGAPQLALIQVQGDDAMYELQQYPHPTRGIQTAVKDCFNRAKRLRQDYYLLATLQRLRWLGLAPTQQLNDTLWQLGWRP